jgi:diguanylate cyclase (GGDEF)-like protein
MALILIVEDDLEMNALMALTLGMDKHEVAQAYDATQALKLANELAPDLILLDVMLPQMNGYEIAHTLQSQPATAAITIIFVTAKQDVEDLVQGLETAVDYIFKPFAIPELRARVRAALRVRALQAELRQTNERLELLAITDELTGVCNRRGFNSALEDEIWRARRFGEPLAVLLFDLDRFKSINDKWGHPQGDAVLQAFARVLVDSSRHVDKVARYGGEEFAVLLPSTDEAGAARYAEKVRSATEALEIPCTLTHSPKTEPIRLTVSGGLAVVPFIPHGQEDITRFDISILANRLIHEADTCLYQAKEAGRNRIVMKTVDDLGLPQPLSRESVSAEPVSPVDEPGQNG